MANNKRQRIRKSDNHLMNLAAKKIAGGVFIDFPHGYIPTKWDLSKERLNRALTRNRQEPEDGEAEK